MRILLPLAILLFVACAHPGATTQVSPPPKPSIPVSGVAVDGGVAATAAHGLEPEAATENTDEETEEDEEEAPVEEETESREPTAGLDGGFQYTRDLSDEVLREKWAHDLPSLGSISIGFADEGRLINAEKFPAGPEWTVVSPSRTWGTRESIDFLIAAIREVRRTHPGAPPLRVNQMSAQDGGYLPPHKSHQSGRDVDVAFYYRVAPPSRTRDRWKFIDAELDWSLLKALVTLADVQVILVDRKVQKVLYDHALSAGEDKAWLDSLFRKKKGALIQHARRHRDHFHVRFYNARAQELGRRVAPLLSLRPEQNLAIHRVVARNTLGAIAKKYGTTVEAIKRANHLRGSFLRLGQRLRVPLRGPCTHCPVPPPMVVPSRLLPPAATETVTTD